MCWLFTWLACLQAEERRRMEADNKALIAEELERMNIETEHEKAEIQVSLLWGIFWFIMSVVEHCICYCLCFSIGLNSGFCIEKFRHKFSLEMYDTMGMWSLFTQGQFWPSCIVVTCVCVSVCLCVNHLLVRAITWDPFKLGSPNLDQRCKRPWLKSLLFCGLIDLDLQGQI